MDWMEPFAIALVLTSAGIHAVRDFLTKRAGDKQVFMWWFTLWSVILMLPLYWYFGMQPGAITKTGLMIAGSVSIVHFLYWVFLSKSLEHGDLSHVYPIIRSSPAIVLLFTTLFFEEVATARGATGIFLVVAGAYLINMKRLSLRELIAPFQRIHGDHATIFALLTLLTVSTYSVVDKQGVSHMHPVVYLFLINFLSWVLYTPFVLLTKSHDVIVRTWKTMQPSILLNAAGGMLSYGMILYAFTMEPASYVVGLRQISVIFAVLLGGHLLQEKHKLIRLMAAIIIFAGAILIATG